VISRAAPVPPRPDLVRRPRGAFGWLDAALLHDRWLAEVGPHAVAVMVLLAIAADRRGASFYRRERMAIALGMSRYEVDDALQRLLDVGLVVMRPWRPGGCEGVWQLLPPSPSPRREVPRDRTVLTAADVLRSLGFQTP
jgi:hypothetical protein